MPVTAAGASPHDVVMTEITGTEALTRVAELVSDIDITMLTTVDDDGNLVSRPMSTRRMDDDGNIWFFTAEDTEKVEEARRHHDVGLAYCDAKGMRYVSVAGTAEVVHDRAMMEELYTPSLDIWFADGLDTPGIALLRVTPTVAEFWEPAKGRIALAAGALKALVTHDTPDDDTMNHGRIVC
jgi:general stress protein 26